MKSYIIFVMKRCWHRKINVALMALVLLIISGIFFMNLTNQSRLIKSLERAKNEYSVQAEEYKQRLDNEKKDLDFILETYNSSIEKIKTYESLCEDFNENNKKAFYQGYIKMLNENKATALENEDHQKEMVEDFSRQLAYFTHLERYDLDYEDMNYPIFALPFLVSLFENILLLIVLVLSIYISAQIYTFNYHQSMDLGKLLPYGNKQIVFMNIFISILVSLGILFVSMLFTILLSLVFTQNIGLDYPILITTVSNSVLDVLLKDLLLSFEILIFANLSCLMVSQFIHDEMTIMFLFVLVIVLFGYLSGYLGILKPFIHFIPFTYIQTGNIINGTLSLLLNNDQLTFNMGVLSLGIYICCLVGCLYLYFVYQRKNT